MWIAGIKMLVFTDNSGNVSIKSEISKNINGQQWIKNRVGWFCWYTIRKRAWKSENWLRWIIDSLQDWQLTEVVVRSPPINAGELKGCNQGLFPSPILWLSPKNSIDCQDRADIAMTTVYTLGSWMGILVWFIWIVALNKSKRRERRNAN